MAKVTEGIPIANFSFSKEDLQEIVDEKVKEIELDIQAIRNKAIDDFVKELKDRLINNYRHLLTIDTDGFEWLTTDSVYTHIDKIAQQLKDGGKNENTNDKLS